MRIVLLEESTVTTLSPQHQEILLAHSSEPSAATSTVTVRVEFINPANLRVLKVGEVTRRAVSWENRREVEEAREFLERQGQVVSSRVREVLVRYQPGGIAQQSFFLGYSIMFGNSFGCEAQCLGYSAYGFEDTLRKIPAVLVTQGDILVWEKMPSVSVPAGAGAGAGAQSGGEGGQSVASEGLCLPFIFPLYCMNELAD